MKQLLIILSHLVIFCSCQEEIELDYRVIQPLYVIDGGISNEGCDVTITTTRDMDIPDVPSGIAVQSVIISSVGGEKETLSRTEDGTYKSATFIGQPGMTYNLSVVIDGKEYMSESTMPDFVTIESTSMHWEEMMGDDMLHLIVDVRDIGSDINYYYYRILRNGRLYKWNVTRDIDSGNSTMQFDISLMSKDKAEKNDPDDYDSIIFEGDCITVEVHAVDLKSYDYLFSAKLSGQNSSNAISNFNTSEVLGYFSAYSTVKKNFDFHYAGI